MIIVIIVIFILQLISISQVLGTLLIIVCHYSCNPKDYVFWPSTHSFTHYQSLIDLILASQYRILNILYSIKLFSHPPFPIHHLLLLLFCLYLDFTICVWIVLFCLLGGYFNSIYPITSFHNNIILLISLFISLFAID